MLKNKVTLKDDYAIIEAKRKDGNIYNVLVDLDTLENLNNLRNNLTIGITFNNNKIPYARFQASKKVVLLHRFVLDYNDILAIDHVNNNSLDCRKRNLRKAEFSTNASNRKILTNTEIKGVQKENTNYIAKKLFEGITMTRKCKSLEEAEKIMKLIDDIIETYINR